MLESLEIPAVVAKIQKSLDLLRTTYRSSGGHGGWYHYLDSEKPGPTASAVGLMAFKYAKVRFEHANEVMAFLKARQLCSEEPLKNGGWSISVLPDQPSVEATGWVVKCLGDLHPVVSAESPDIAAAYSWLLRNKNDDHGWGSYRGQPSRTYLTCLALRAIAAVDPFAETLLLGQKWLFENKNRHLPAWGATPASPPTVLHTGFVLLTLAEIAPGYVDRVISDALEWLAAKTDTRRLVELESLVEDYDITYRTPDAPQIYQNSLPHYALPVAISAFLRHRGTLDKSLIYKGLLTIMNTQQENGYWENARNPARISMWAIWPFLQTLFDATNLSLMPSAYSVTKVSNAVIIRTTRSRAPLALLMVSDFATLALSLLKAYWSGVFLGLCLVAGLIVTSIGLIGLKELLLSLLLPVILVFVQISLDRRRGEK